MHHDDTTLALIQEGAKQIAALRDGNIDEGHITEHIRGMVAASMGNQPADVPDLARNHTEQWQQWALGVADGIELPISN